ncbi:MAG: hypothetical protein ACQSGP_06405 [Frankia sp.]
MSLHELVADRPTRDRLKDVVLVRPIGMGVSRTDGEILAVTADALLAAFPVVAGPILLVTELQHGRQFAAHAARASLLGLVTLALFALVFARTSRSLRWMTTLAVGWIICLAADVAISTVTVPPLIGLACAWAAAGFATAVMPVAAPLDDNAPDGRERPRWDLPARAVAAAVLVLTLTGGAAALGPRRTGVLAPFPIATSIVATFTLAQQGWAPTVALLRGVLRGLTGFATFCFLVAVLLIPAGALLAFATALGGAFVVQLALWVVLRPGFALPPARDRPHPRPR